MKVHEYQAKDCLARFGIAIPRGRVAQSDEEAAGIAHEIGGSVWAVKAQIHSGGRGKAGGIKIARSHDDVRAHAADILGMNLITEQTGPQGRRVNRVLVEEGLDVEREFYAGISLDRALGRLVMMGCSDGGVEIEKIAAQSSEKIVKVVIDPAVGYTPYIGRKLASNIGLKGEEGEYAADFFGRLYALFTSMDCSMIEINPFVVTKNHRVVALDAKISFDDNALFRHDDVNDMRDIAEETRAETESRLLGVSYVKLDGDIACMVNGAGLAMATLDIIKLGGGTPANFLDVGGMASKEVIQKSFGILVSDSGVKAVLVNIFGGVMKCDTVAEGVVAAIRELAIAIPVVIRLEGTNVTLGKKIIAQCGPNVIQADDFADAAQKVIRALPKGVS